MRRRPRDAHRTRQRPSLTAERGASRRRAALSRFTAAQPSAAPNAAKNWCTRGNREAAHKRRKPKPSWLGLLVVVGHSGLEPEANGLRIHCSTN